MSAAEPKESMSIEMKKKCRKGFFIAKKLMCKRDWEKEFTALSQEEQECFKTFVKTKRTRRAKGTAAEGHVGQPKKPYSSWQLYCQMRRPDYTAAKEKFEKTNPGESFPGELKWCKPLWEKEPKRQQIELQAKKAAAAYAKEMDEFFEKNPGLEDPRKHPKKKREPAAEKPAKKKAAAKSTAKAVATKKVKAEASTTKVMAREAPTKEVAEESAEEPEELDF